MCEETYLACPSCHTDFTQDGEYREDERLTRTYCVQSDGEPEYDAPSDSDSETIECSYYCRECGAEPNRSELIENYSPDDCDCDECEPEITDPDELVQLVRAANIENSLSLSHQLLMDQENTPPEVALLLSRRSIRQLPVRRERADELELWLERVGNRGELQIENRTPPASHLALAIPEPTEQLSLVEHESEAA